MGLPRLRPHCLPLANGTPWLSTFLGTAPPETMVACRCGRSAGTHELRHSP